MVFSSRFNILIQYFCQVVGLEATKIIYVESICRVKSLSLSGRILYYFADHILVQWKSLLQQYPHCNYIGRLIWTCPLYYNTIPMHICTLFNIIFYVNLIDGTHFISVLFLNHHLNGVLAVLNYMLFTILWINYVLYMIVAFMWNKINNNSWRKGITY